MTGARPPVPLPEPPLVDGELLLRPWHDADTPSLVAAWHDPEVVRWTGVPAATDAGVARRWISGDAHRRARGLALDLVIDLDGAVAGEVGLAEVEPVPGTAEIGWWVAPPWRRQGLAARAARLLAGWAVQELAVSEVLARCDRANPGSAGVARAAGFERAGVAGAIEVWRFT